MIKLTEEQTHETHLALRDGMRLLLERIDDLLTAGEYDSMEDRMESLNRAFMLVQQITQRNSPG